MTLRHRSLGAALAVAALAGVAGSAQAAPQFVNGGFEVGTSAGWDFSDATNTPGWTLLSSGSFPRINLNIASGGPYGANNELRQFETIGGIEDGETSAIAQTITGFSTGKMYTLSWIQSSEFTHADELLVSISGASGGGGVFTSNPFPGSGQFWYGWQTFTTTFKALGPSVTFQFQGNSPANYEVGVDAFQILSSGTPEPTTWAMLLTGFGLVGFATRRRNKAASIAA